GDAQTKLNAVMNGQADLLLGYVMDQAIKLQDATHKAVHPIRFADYGVNLISSGIIANTSTLKDKPDMVRRFLRATTKAMEEIGKESRGGGRRDAQGESEGRRARDSDHRPQADDSALSHQGNGQ